MRIVATYGYCRISTRKQSIERQIRNIIAVEPSAVIFQEAYTGTSMERKEWKRLCSRVKSGDTIIFDSVSRMSRDAEEGFAAYKDLYDKNITLVFLKEPHINTDTYRKALESGVPMTGTNVDFILEGVNKYLMALAAEQIRLAFAQAEKEVDDLRKRTSEGLKTAAENGKQIGQPKGAKLTTKKSVEKKQLMRKHCVDFGGSVPDKEMLEMLKINRNTYYKYKRELKEEGMQLGDSLKYDKL